MKYRILIGIPSHTAWKADFGLCLTNMCMQTLRYGDKDVSVASSKGSMLSRQRHELVMQAKKIEATHLLFLDSDLVFPDDTLDQLLFREKEVVAANYVMKMVPPLPTTRKWKDGQWKFVMSGKDRSGIEKVDRLPTGCMLLAMGVFDRAAQPWFAFPWCGEDDAYQGEDWTFCERLEEAGVEMFVDHDLSQEVGHIGDFVFKNAQVREKDCQVRPGKNFRTWKERGLEWQG